MLRIGQVESSATTDGKYTDGNVAGGISATRLRASAFNAIQEELAHIVESTGEDLDVDDMTQVLTALKVMFAANTESMGALAALVGAANKLPYFTGQKAAALADLTAFARQILAQTDAAGVLSIIGITALGLGGFSVSKSNFDWQTAVFEQGGLYNISRDTAINVPPGLELTPIYMIECIAVHNPEGAGRRAVMRVSMVNNSATRKAYEIVMYGAFGSRTFSVSEIMTSGNPTPITAGGTGATTAAGALTNLGLKSAATRDVGTGANQIPDMSAWTGSFGASESAGTWYKMPNGIIVQEGIFTSVSSGQASVTLPIPFTSRILSFSASKNNGFFTPIISPNGGSLSTFYLGATNGTGNWASGDLIHWRLEGI